MKMILWVILGCAVTGLAIWIVTSNATIPLRPLSILVLLLIFGVSPIGSFWMLYTVIRYEKRPLPYVLLDFVPYLFLGYYFERIRGKKLGDNSRMRLE